MGLESIPHPNSIAAKLLHTSAEFSNKELMLIRLLAANAMIAPDVSRTAMTAHENVIAVANAILAHRAELLNVAAADTEEY